jgi:tetratricopeptide (TPR) repeat protein
MMTKARVGRFAVALLGAACLAGCSSNDKSAISGVSSSTAQDVNAQRNVFERSDDPPLKADTHFAAGQFAESQGAAPQAIKQYEEAVRLNPRHAQALFRLGTLYAQAQDYPAAIGAWKKYLGVTNNSAIGFSNLGFAQQLAEDYPAAEASYKSAIQRDPKNRASRVNYGVMLAKLGRPDEALAQFKAVLSPADAYYNLGAVYERTGKKEAAREQYTKALAVDPSFADAQVKLADLK